MTTWTKVGQELHYTSGSQWLRWTGAAWSSTNGAPFEPAGVQEGDLCVAVIYYKTPTTETVISGWTEHERHTAIADNTGSTPSVILVSAVRGASPLNMAWPVAYPAGFRVNFIWYRADAGTATPAFEASDKQNHTSVVSDITLDAGLTTAGTDELLILTGAQGVGVAPTAASATDPSVAAGSTQDTTTAPTQGTWINRRTEVAGNLGYIIAEGVKATAGGTGVLHVTGGQTRTSIVVAARFSAAAAADVTPPTFSVAPAVTGISATGGTFSATINETGDIFYVVVPQADGTPSITEVIAGQAAGGGAPIDSGSALAGTSISDAFTGTTGGVAYKAVAVARDDEGTPNVQAAVTVVNFTATASDTTPPTFSVAPAVSGLSQTGGTLSATINETGDIFYVIVPQAAASPTPSEVIAGQSSGGGSPLDSGSALAGTTISDAFTGLTAGTAYKAAVVARDDEGTPNVQATVTTVNFTTTAAATGTLTMVSPANAANDALTAQNIIVKVANATTGVDVISPVTVAYTSGSLVVTHASVVAGTDYVVTMINAAGEVAVAVVTAT